MADNGIILFAVLAGIAALSIVLERRYRWAARLTGCVIALLISMVLTNLNVIPAEAPAYDFVWDFLVPASIPMLLFKADIRSIGRRSGRMMAIYLLSGAGTIAGGFLAYEVLRSRVGGLAYALPMMIGTYTGGSVNLAAMANVYHAPSNLISAAVVADNLLMAIYFFILAIIPESKWFLKNYPHPVIDKEAAGTRAGNMPARPENSGKRQAALKGLAFDIVWDFALSIGIAALSKMLAGIFSSLIPDRGFFLTLLRGLVGNQYLLITTITVVLATAFSRKLGNLRGAQEIGTYAMHIFFAVIGVPASISLIVTKMPLLLIFCLIIVAANMIVSFALGRLLHFDLEEIILASNANIGGPTTAAAMAASRGWTGLIVPAVLVGTLGYVLGNYYGVFAGTILGL